MQTYTEQDEWAALRAYAHDGDPEAFEVLVRRYQSMVYATCQRQLGNTTDAEDATQETFLKLARKAGAIRSSLSAWLHSCAVGTSRDLIRRQATRRKHEQEAGQTAAPTQDATWDQLGPVIDDAMESLPKSQRDLLVERFLVGVPQTQIAEREGVSPSAIHQRVNTAVENLRKKLAKKGLPVAAVALSALMTQAAQASVPQAVTASAMKIGLAGIGSETSKSILSTLIQQFMETSLMTKLTAAAVALALIGGTTVTVNQLRSASPPPPTSAPAPTAPASVQPAPAPLPMAEDPAKQLEGTWINRSWKMDNEPATSLKIKGKHIHMKVPSHVPGGDPIKLTLEILETDPDASPSMIIYQVIKTSSPTIPVTGQPVVASYGVDGMELKLAINFTSDVRPDSLEAAPGRVVLACFKELTEGTHPKMADGLDPELAGTWSGFLPLLLQVKDGMCYMKSPNGDILTQSQVISFDPSSKPMRLEVVATMSSEMPNLVGTHVKYLVEINGNRVKYANYEIRSPKQGQWPRDFKGRKGDQLSTTIWDRVEEE